MRQQADAYSQKAVRDREISSNRRMCWCEQFIYTRKKMLLAFEQRHWGRTQKWGTNNEDFWEEDFCRDGGRVRLCDFNFRPRSIADIHPHPGTRKSLDRLLCRRKCWRSLDIRERQMGPVAFSRSVQYQSNRGHVKRFQLRWRRACWL